MLLARFKMVLWRLGRSHIEQIVVSHNNSVCLGLEVPVSGCNLETNNWLVAPAMGPGVLGTWHRLPWWWWARTSCQLQQLDGGVKCIILSQSVNLGLNIDGFMKTCFGSMATQHHSPLSQQYNPWHQQPSQQQPRGSWCQVKWPMDWPGGMGLAR